MANLPEGEDPAGVAERNPEEWRNILRESLPAVEFFFNKVSEAEKDSRKIGKQIEKRILPLIKLLGSSIEQSHFISMIAKRTGIKEEVLWDDLKKVEIIKREIDRPSVAVTDEEKIKKTPKEQIEERLAEIKLWQNELPETAPEMNILKKEEVELADNLSNIILHTKLNELSSQLSHAEVLKDGKLTKSLTAEIQEVHKQMRTLEEKREIL